MRNAVVLGALAALSARASGASTSTCTESTITITAAAQATGLGCEVVSGTLYIDDTTLTEVSLDGPEQVGSIVVAGAKSLVRLSSSTISTISGIFNLTELDGLSSLEFSSLRSVDTINWVALGQLPGVTFGSEGVTKVSSMLISDTFISSFDGLNVASVDTMEISNNRKLVTWDSDLVNVTNSLKLQGNGNGAMVVNMGSLETVAAVEVRNVQEFTANLLTTATSLRFDENENLQSFDAPNVTDIAEISFTNNAAITNITFPKLTSMSGALTIQNNTNLKTIDGFPNLKTIGGTLILRGDFTNATLPSLNQVNGQGVITSTQNISSSCVAFDELISNSDIAGDDSSCTSNNEAANEGGNEGTGNSSSDDSAAGTIAISFTAALGAVMLGALALL